MNQFLPDLAIDASPFASYPKGAVVIAEDDSWSWIEPLLIVSLDSLPTPKGGQNGKSRGKK